MRLRFSPDEIQDLYIEQVWKTAHEKWLTENALFARNNSIRPLPEQTMTKDPLFNHLVYGTDLPVLPLYSLWRYSTADLGHWCKKLVIPRSEKWNVYLRGQPSSFVEWFNRKVGPIVGYLITEIAIERDFEDEDYTFYFTKTNVVIHPGDEYTYPRNRGYSAHDLTMYSTGNGVLHINGRPYS